MVKTKPYLSINQMTGHVFIDDHELTASEAKSFAHEVLDLLEIDDLRTDWKDRQLRIARTGHAETKQE